MATTLFACEKKKDSENKEKAEVENSAQKQEEIEKAIPSYYTSGIPVYEKFDELEPLLRTDNDSTYVVNFWATWCKPCIKELPYFKELDSVYNREKVRIVLVSLDFPKDVETKLVSFAKENKIESNVVVLLDGKQNDWIDKVSPQWSGAIPATYIYNRNKSEFFQTSFESTEELMDVVKPFL